MSDISKIKSAVIEKQDIILNRLNDLSYDESMKLLASLSSLITNIDRLQAEEENRCNKLIVQHMTEDPRATFSKAEAVLKASELYVSYKNILSLKQCTARGLGIVKLHLHHLLRTKPDGDEMDGV
jgi:hypothetical protein